MSILMVIINVIGAFWKCCIFEINAHFRWCVIRVKRWISDDSSFFESYQQAKSIVPDRIAPLTLSLSLPPACLPACLCVCECVNEQRALSCQLNRYTQRHTHSDTHTATHTQRLEMPFAFHREISRELRWKWIFWKMNFVGNAGSFVLIIQISG